MTSSAPTLQHSPAGSSRLLRLAAWGPYLVLAAALAFLGWCTLSAIERPGVQYDEVLFVNAALGGDFGHDAFIAERFLGIPTMVMPYSGALKAWLWAPVFEVAGVSVTTIRLPAVLTLALTVVLAFAFARRAFGAWPAALLAVLIASDPSFMTMAKADWGPVALSALFRVVALGAYLMWSRTSAVRWLWLLGAAIALGVFNKLDFLAFVAALALAAVVVDHRGVLRRLRERTLAVSLSLGALAGILLLEYVKIVVPARDFPVARSEAGLWGRVEEVWAMARTTMDGTAIYPYMTTQHLSHKTAVAAIAIAGVALAGALALWRIVRLRGPLPPAQAPLGEAAGVSSFLLVLLLAMTAALVLTPEAIGPHHAMLLWPLPALLGVSLLAAASRLPAVRVRAAAAAVLALGLVWLAVTQVRLAEDYRAGFAKSEAWQPAWSPEIYAVIDAVRLVAPGVDGIVTADWGFGNQLLALGGDEVRRRLNDNWGAFAGGSPDAADQLAAAALDGRRSLLVLHPPGSEVMPGTYETAHAMLRRLSPARGVDVLHRGSAGEVLIVDDRPRGD